MPPNVGAILPLPPKFASPNAHKAEELIEELGMGLSSKKLKKAMAQLDPGGEGVVWKDEFLNWYAENGQGG